MKNRLDDLLIAFILLAMPLVLGIEHFITETSVSQFITGLLIGLTIVAGIVYTYRISSQTRQKR